MKPQLDNRVVSSVLLWLDHTLLEKGEAFTNVSGNFYKINSNLNNYYAYSLPFKQVVSDTSISNSNILSGIYLNGNFITTGQSGLLGINFNEGQVYFSQSVDSQTISGRYAIKDFNVYLTSEPESKLLFETKFEPRQKISKNLTGLAPQTMTYPSVFIKYDGTYNEPLAFGGLDTTTFNIKLVILADSQFSSDALTSIIRDKEKTFIPIFSEPQMPYNIYGDVKGGNYNYNLVAQNINFENLAFLCKISTSQISYRSAIINEIRSLNPGIFPNVIDMKLEMVRNPRI